MGKVKNFLMGLAIFGGAAVMTGCENKNENQTEDNLPPTEQKTDESSGFLRDIIADIKHRGVPIGIPVVKEAIQAGEVDSLLQSIEVHVFLDDEFVDDEYGKRIYQNPTYMSIMEPAWIEPIYFGQEKKAYAEIHHKAREYDPLSIRVNNMDVSLGYNPREETITSAGDTIFYFDYVAKLKLNFDYDTKHKIQEAKDRIAAKHNIETEVLNSKSHNNSQRSITDLTVASVKEVEK